MSFGAEHMHFQSDSILTLNAAYNTAMKHSVLHVKSQTQCIKSIQINWYGSIRRH